VTPIGYVPNKLVADFRGCSGVTNFDKQKIYLALQARVQGGGYAHADANAGTPLWASSTLWVHVPIGHG
jgi:hypothetical protein